MRIVSGTMGGRNFEAPKTHRTHPMAEKIRGALFNSLGELSGLTVLDAYSGSGAVAFEAISRGAKYALSIEAEKAAYDTIVRSRDSLGLEEKQHTIVLKRCESWSRQNQDKLFDIVIIDPPYDRFRYNYLTNERMTKHVKSGGLFVASIPPDQREYHDHGFNRLTNLSIISEKDYGDSLLIFYKNIG